MALVTVGISPLFTATEGIAAQLSLSADADSYIRDGGSSDNNFGTASGITVKSDNNFGYARKGYLKFDLSSTNTETIIDSELKLTVRNIAGLSSGVLQIYGLNDDNPGENWEENTITWNNAPGNNKTTTQFLSSDVTFLGDISLSGVTPGDTLSFNDPTLIDFLNSDTNDSVTFMFRTGPIAGGDNSLVLASKENPNFSSPNLVLETTTTDVKATPEPTTILGLIGLGMWGVSGKFRKKFN